MTSNRTTERRKPEEIRAENQRRAPLIELGDQVKDKLSDVRLSSLDDSAKSFYKEVGAIRTTNRRGDLTQNPTLGAGGVYKESTFVNVLNSSPTYLNEFNSDPQAFAAKYANDPEFKKNFPSRDTIVKNKAEALKVNDQPSLVEFLQKNVDKNTGAANVSYLSQRARFNLFYAALDSAPDELRKDELFKQTLSNLVSYGIFNAAEPGTDPNKLTPSQQSSIVQATINNPEYQEPLAYFQSLSPESAGRLEDVVGSSAYRKQQIRLYNYVDSLTSDAQLNAVQPAIDLDLALTAKGRSKKGFKGFVGSLIRGEAGYITPDAPAPRFLTYVKTPKGPRMITTIEEVKALAEGDLVLDSIRLQPPRGFGTRGRYLRKSDFFISTSLWEEPGHAILEAGYLNKLIISSNCPNGPREILINNFNALKYESGDIQELSNILKLIIDNKIENEIYLKTNMKKLVKTYSKFMFAKKIQSIFS